MSLPIALLLVLIALVGGACITTIGPGGIFVTIALFMLLDLGPSTVAGTASATFIATGLVGSLAYLRSGELANRQAATSAFTLSIASVVGAFSGSQLNTTLDAQLFGLLLALFVLGTGLIILYRHYRGLSAITDIDTSTLGGQALLALVGLAVGLPGGLLGVGGPVLAVPLLIMLGMPMLLAVALAQVQSIFISAFATAGYAIHGAIDVSLAFLVGIPLLIGTVSGWWIAQRIKPQRLRLFLAFVLVVLGLYLFIAGGTPG